MNRRSTIMLVIAALLVAAAIAWFWGAKKEGFQALSMSVTPPPPTSPTPTPVSQAPEVSEQDELKRKVADIQSNLRVIEQAKRLQEPALYATLDPETVYTLEYMMGEIQMFSGATTPEMRMLTTSLDLFSTLPEPNKAILRQIILTAHQSSQILLYIFSTAPSLIVASGTVVDASTATETTINDPAVSKHSAATIRQLLSTFPNPSAQFKQKKGAFETTIADMTSVSTPSKESLTTAIATFADFQRVTNILLEVYQKALTRSAGPELTVTKPTETTLMKARQDSAQGNYSSVLMSALLSLKEAKAKVDAIAPSNQGNADFSGLQQSLETAIQNYTQREASQAVVPEMGPTPPSAAPPLNMEVPPVMPAPPAVATESEAPAPSAPSAPAVEGFASIGNPYSAPSPNLSQAFEFRLGKRELVDRVMQVAR